MIFGIRSIGFACTGYEIGMVLLMTQEFVFRIDTIHSLNSVVALSLLFSVDYGNFFNINYEK